MTDAEKLQLEEDRTTFELKCLLDIKDFKVFQDEAEKIWILDKLKKHNFNVSKTAIEIRIQRSHLYNKIIKYKIPINRKLKHSYLNGRHMVIFNPNGDRFDFIIKNEPELTETIKSGLQFVYIRKSNLAYMAKKIFSRIENLTNVK